MAKSSGSPKYTNSSSRNMDHENGDGNKRQFDDDDEQLPGADNVSDDEELQNYFLNSMPPSKNFSSWKFNECSSLHDGIVDREMNDTASKDGNDGDYSKSTETNENDESRNSASKDNDVEDDFAPRREKFDDSDENQSTFPADPPKHLNNGETAVLNSEDEEPKGRSNLSGSTGLRDGDHSEQISKIDNSGNVPSGSTVPESASKAINSNTISLTVSIMHGQHAFMKRGARVRALLTKALRSVVDGSTSHTLQESLSGDINEKEVGEGDKYVIGRKRGSGECVCDDSAESRLVKKPWNPYWDLKHLPKLAQEKSEECIVLKRKLQEMESTINNIRNENKKAEQVNDRLQIKLDRTTEALNIAGTRAANSRAEADAANARAESLSTQLNDLQYLIEETGRVMEVVRTENDEVSRAARSVEGRLIQVESELARAMRLRKTAENERDSLKARAETAEKEVGVLREKANDCLGEIRLLKKNLSEVDELEKIRSDRSNRTETELQEARATLFEATSAAAEAESTVTSLRSAIDALRQENESLHTKISEDREGFAKDRSKHNEALTVAEKEVQMWKMKYEEDEEEIRKLKLDKASAGMQFDQMKTRMANLEKRLHESNNCNSSKQSITSRMPTVTPKSSDLGVINAFGANDNTYETQPSEKRQYVCKLPMRASPEPISDYTSRKLFNSSTMPSYFSGKEQSGIQQMQTNRSGNNNHLGELRKATKSGKCCICLNDFSGMMKSCQCGKLKCEKRAHASCVMKSSKAGAIRSGILCKEN